MRSIVNKLLFVNSLSWLIATNVAAENMSFERQISMTIDDLKSVEIITGAGSLEVLGGTGNLMVVKATVESKDYSEMAEFVEIFDTRMLFYLKQNNQTAQLMAKPRKSMYNTPNIQINLRVTLPSQLNLNVDDGSGLLKIENISGKLYVDDESGSLRIKKIRNDLSIKDGSGSISISDIVGQVNIDDKAGSIILSDIHGDVMIKDRSGSIDAEKITGNFNLDDGSGDVEIDGLSGQFILLGAGSGKIRVNGESWPKK